MGENNKMENATVPLIFLKISKSRTRAIIVSGWEGGAIWIDKGLCGRLLDHNVINKRALWGCDGAIRLTLESWRCRRFKRLSCAILRLQAHWLHLAGCAVSAPCLQSSVSTNQSVCSPHLAQLCEKIFDRPPADSKCLI